MSKLLHHAARSMFYAIINRPATYRESPYLIVIIQHYNRLIVSTVIWFTDIVRIIAYIYIQSRTLIEIKTAKREMDQCKVGA